MNDLSSCLNQLGGMVGRGREESKVNPKQAEERK